MKPISKNWTSGEPKPSGLVEWQAAHGLQDDDPLLPLINRTFELQTRFGQIVGDEAEKLVTLIRQERTFFESAEQNASKAIMAMTEQGRQSQAERQAKIEQLTKTERVLHEKILQSLEEWRTEMSAASCQLVQQSRFIESQQTYLLSLDSHLAANLGPKLAAVMAARVDEMARKVDLKKLEASLDYLEEATKWLEEFRPQTERELKAAATAVNEQIPRLAQLVRLIQTVQEENQTQCVIIALLLGGLGGAAITWFLMR